MTYGTENDVVIYNNKYLHDANVIGKCVQARYLKAS